MKFTNNGIHMIKNKEVFKFSATPKAPPVFNDYAYSPRSTYRDDYTASAIAKSKLGGASARAPQENPRSLSESKCLGFDLHQRRPTIDKASSAAGRTSSYHEN